MPTYVFFNYRSANGKGALISRSITKYLDTEPVFLPVSDVGYAEFFAAAKPDDRVILCGGDGTLNRFINNTKNLVLPEDLMFYSAGSGNDFRKDIGIKETDGPVPIMRYLKNLPTVYVNGLEKKFFNGIGYGIDGYCCEIADRQREKNDKRISYTKIALRGVLYDFNPVNAVITVDGKRMEFHDVWMAPTMKGRYFGGGMMITPDQNRDAADHHVSVAVLHGASRTRLLTAFPSIYKGAHVKYKEYFQVFTGHHITVAFDRPVALQIDGDTVLGVTEYTVIAPKE